MYFTFWGFGSRGAEDQALRRKPEALNSGFHPHVLTARFDFSQNRSKWVP